MARWLADQVPEWITGPLFIVGLPALMLLLQRLVHKRMPHWREGEHNDATGIMLSVAAVVYSVSIGLCVVTLWQALADGRAATAAEADNLAAIASGSRVCDATVRDRIHAEVIAYNRDVVAHWSLRIHGKPTPEVAADLDQLTDTVGAVRPATEPQRAYVQDATARLARAAELRSTAIRLARDEQLPNVLWVAVLGGSLVVLGLCLTCGVQDGVIRRILMVGVAAVLGTNLFLVEEMNYPFYGSVSVGPDAYVTVVTELEHDG